MRIANVEGRGSLIVNGRVVDVESATAGAITSDPMELVDLRNHPQMAKLRATEESRDIGEFKLGPPVPRPGKVIAIALNYRSHAEEANKPIPTEPHVMVKFSTCITGPYDDVFMHDLEMVDYEVELVLAVGRRGVRIPSCSAWEHVSGLTIGNDVSDRNEQFRPPIRQFSMAKSYDGFGPIGPILVTPDELQERDDIEISLEVDGELRQHARTSDFIFPVPVLIEWLSKYVTLEVGDLIFTGTTGGVGDSMDPPTYLRHNQIVEASIEGIGSIRNRFIAGDRP
jgi:2,4-diketo-3-deoxy-L-fuconate hydrolase